MEARGVSIKITLKPPDMEYGNYYKSKYTTLHITTTLYWKKDEQKVKNDTDANPPRGDGEQDRKSPFEEVIILLKEIKISENWN